MTEHREIYPTGDGGWSDDPAGKPTGWRRGGPIMHFPSPPAHGRELKNNGRRLLAYRRSLMLPIGPPLGWARLCAYVAFLIEGEVTQSTMRRWAGEIGLVINKDINGGMLLRAGREAKGADGLAVTSRFIGRELAVKAAERDAIGWRKLRRMSASDIDSADHKKLRRSAAAAAKRAANGATPRSQSNAALRPWEAEGISKSQWHRNNKKAAMALIRDPIREEENRMRSRISRIGSSEESSDVA